MKTSELIGMQLDWAVAKAEGYPDEDISIDWNYSTDWRLCGSLIEREGIALYLYGDAEWNTHTGNKESTNSTPLVAAMRCYVASKLSDEVEVPKEGYDT
jgi:hypothetical protein